MLGSVVHNPGGGPGGAEDAFLEIEVTGFHLGTKNMHQWAGDYLAAGIDAIEMDLNHIHPETDRLNMRLLLFGPGGTFASREVTPDLPANTWTHYVFGLSADDLVHVSGGTGELNETLAAVTTLLVRHDRPTPTVPGRHPPHITARLGIDNIHAVPRKPVIGVPVRSGSQVAFSINGLVAGMAYVVESAEELAPGRWTEAYGFPAAADTTDVTVTLAAPASFVRVRTR